MYLRPAFIDKLRALQSAIAKASVDIVDRWFTDESAGFPARMPLEPHEHELVKWVASSGVVPPYNGRQGCWRPDFLFSSSDEPRHPIVCEINARFPYNAWLLIPLVLHTFEKLGLARGGLKASHNYDETETAILSLFDTLHPVHVLMGEEWKGLDIHLLTKIYESKTGQPMRFIYPDNLRLTANSSSLTGYRLSCVTTAGDGSKTVERIWQVSMEIKQRELRPFDPLILRELTRVCVNDFRSIFFVNDQRFLGIVLEEVDNLVALGVLEAAEAETLKLGLAPTYLPGSAVWRELASTPSSLPKDDFILKCARDGEGKGHVFGHRVSQQDWMAHLQHAADGHSASNADNWFALQQKVDQFWFDILNLDGNEMRKLHVVGSWSGINGRFLGTLGFRIAEDFCIKVAPGEKGIAMLGVTDADVDHGKSAVVG